MATATYDRILGNLINKLRKLKDYNDQKKELERSSSG